MFKNKENIIIGLLIVLILGNTFMSYRNFMIAREADRIARCSTENVQIIGVCGITNVHAAYVNDLVYLINNGTIPTLGELNKMVVEKQAQLKAQSNKK